MYAAGSLQHCEGRQAVVGIIGGMGPAATADLMQRVIAATPAKDDVDHIHMLIDNNPKVPSRIKALIEGTGPSPLEMLQAMARNLEAQGAAFLAMPCNTAHHYHAELASAVGIPFLNIMELAVDQVLAAQPGIKRVGLLASSALKKIALYEPWFEQRDVQLVYPRPQKQEALMRLIGAVKANANDETQYRALLDAAEDLKSAGAQCLLIACTELSVIGRQLESSLPCYDAADILAQAIVVRVLGSPG